MKQNTNFLKITGLSAFALAALFLVGSKAQAADPAGLVVFKKYTCNACHAISSLGVKVEEDKGAKDDDGEKSNDDTDPPDLSGVGLEKDMDAGWIRKYMRKSVSLHDKKHQKRFKGEKEELDALVEWLVTLKTKVAQTPKKKK